MQGPLSTATVSKSGWRSTMVSKREESGLYSHVPDAQHPAAVHAALRPAAVGLQRPSVRL